MPTGRSQTEFKDVVALAVAGYARPADETRRCALRLTDSPESQRIVELGDRQARLLPETTAFDAEIVLAPSIVDAILENSSEVDFRLPKYQAAMTLSGDAGLALHVLEAMLRPSASTVARFQRAERLTKAGELEAPTPLSMSSASREQVETAIAASRPLILDGLAAHWPFAASGLEALAIKFGSVPIPFRHRGRDLTINEFMALLALRRERAPTRRVYSEGCRLPDPLGLDFPPPWFSIEEMIYPQLWFGAAANDDQPITPLHRDRTGGFLGQVYGRKRVRLLPPSEVERLHPLNAFNTYQRAGFPDLETAKNDPTRFPGVEGARFLDVILDAGQLLVTPAGWFHCVYALTDPSLSVSYFLTEAAEDDIVARCGKGDGDREGG